MISIAGVPKILSDFIPDNGLATLAACLRNTGHNSIILDFNTTETLGKVFEEKSLLDIRPIAEKVFIDKKKPTLLDIIRLKILSNRVEKQKHKVFGDISENICRIVKENNIDFVGIKLWAGDGFMYSLMLAEKLKEKFPHIKIFGGGPQVDIFQQDIFRVTDSFDALCFGEGEETIVGLAEMVSGRVKINEIPNLIFRQNGTVVRTERRFISELGNTPFPEYHPSVYKDINNKIKLFVLDESRGCQNCCAFCIHPVKSGRIRKKPVERILAEIEKSVFSYSTRLFRYAGSNTPDDILEAVARKLIDREIKISYSCFGNFETMKNIDFRFVRKSGCISIFFGLESGSPEILRKAMHKKNCLEDAETVIKNCKKAGIFTVVSVIYPAPFETEKTRKETIDFLVRTMPDSVLVQFPGLFPQTTWGRNPEKFNFTLETETYELDVMTYQIKQFFPPRYWKPLPYRVNGMSFRQYAAETARFQKDLDKAGITTFVSDEAYLLSKFAGFEKPSDFIDRNRYFLFAGLAEEVRSEINVINNNSGAMK
ncbi:MAG: B12-binding domain-containing radical SAM protein [Candidatus Omnitrophica bacterium]|nr:B12-binding domain-containing radical SAM protein [Candidatus Omnitrophota bacterium]